MLDLTIVHLGKDCIQPQTGHLLIIQLNWLCFLTSQEKGQEVKKEDNELKAKAS